MAGNSTSLGKLVVDLLLKDDQFKEAMGKAAGTTSTTMPSIQKTATKAMNAVKTAFKAAGAAVAAFGTAAGVVGAQFQQQMSAVAAVRGITDQTSEAFTALEEKARELGATTAFSATEAAQGMEALARAGLQTNEIIAASEVALKMAGAGQIELGRSAEIIAASMRQFGLAAEDATQIADVFTVATQNSLFATEDLAQAMKFAGPVGAAFGKDIVEVTAAVAQFRDLGMEGTMAGTQFRMMMAAAAKPTSQAQAALAKYGLTAADINPELRSFKEIMVNVGEAGISTSDALLIFGTRAGGAVATIANKMAQSSEQFDTLTTKLQNSSGATVTTYATMMDNIMGGLARLRSVVEETLLRLFDQFKGPLMGLLNATVGFVTAVADELGMRGEQMGSSFEDIFANIQAFIEENTAAGARAFVDLLVAAQDLARTLTGLLPAIAAVGNALAVLVPMLDEIAILMATVWAAGKVHALVTAVVALVPALSGATTAVTVFGTALTFSTGGLVAIAGAVAVLVTGLGVLITRYMRAKDAATSFAEEQQRLTKELSRQERVRQIEVGRALARRQIQTRATLDNADAVAQLTDVQRQSFESVLDLTDADAVRLVNQGKMIDVLGELMTVEEALSDVTGKGRAKVLMTIDALEGNLAALRERRAQATGDAEVAIQSEIEQTQRRLRGLEKAVQGQAKVSSNAADATDRQADSLRNLVRGLKGVEEASKDTATAQTEIVDATDGMVAELRDTLAQIGLDEVEQAKFAAAKRREAINKAFDDQIAAEEAQGERLRELRQQQAEALRLAALIEQKKTTQQVTQEEMQLAQGVLMSRKVTATEVEKIQMVRGKTLAKLTHVSASTRADVEAAFDKEIADARARAEQGAQDKLLEIRGKSLSLREQIEREKAQTLIEFADASAETLAAIEDAYAQKLARTLRQQVVDSIRQATVAVVQFGRSAVQAATGALSAVGGLVEKLSGFSFNLQEVISAGMDMQAEALDAQAQAQADIAAAQERLAEAKAAGDATGTAEAQAQLEEAQAALSDAEASLAKGMPGFAQEFVQGMVDDALLFVQALVDGAGPALATLADQLPVLLDAVIAAIPEVVQAFVDNIPAVIQGVVDALPALLDALITGLADIVVAVFDQLPGMITQLLTVVLPSLIQTLAEQLPRMIEAFVAAVPKIIDAVVKAIPVVLAALIEALPVLLESIVQAIPELLGALIGAIPQIIGAVVGMLPQLVTSLVGMVPRLIIAFIRGLPTLISAMISNIPIIVAQVIAALPQIAVALVMAVFTELIPMLPRIVVELFKALIAGMGDALKKIAAGIWNAIKGFFSIFKKNKGGSAAFSGVNYVPATMRMTVHKGEAIVPADRAAEDVQGPQGPAPSGAAALGPQALSGGLQSVSIAVVAEGALLDAVQVRAAQRGHATGVSKAIKRRTGVKLGFQRGKFNAWK